MAKEQTATEYCEEKFPQTTQEFKKILDEMYDTFCKKQRNLIIYQLVQVWKLKKIEMWHLMDFGSERMTRFKD